MFIFSSLLPQPTPTLNADLPHEEARKKGRNGQKGVSKVLSKMVAKRKLEDNDSAAPPRKKRRTEVSGGDDMDMGAEEEERPRKVPAAKSKPETKKPSKKAETKAPKASLKKSSARKK